MIDAIVRCVGIDQLAYGSDRPAVVDPPADGSDRPPPQR